MRITGVCLMLGAAVLVGCSGGGDPTPPPTPVFTTLTVEPSPTTVVIGGSRALTATAKDQNGATMSGLTTAYTSSDNSKATVSTAGVVQGVAAGTATITATGTIGSVTKTATVNVTVGAAPLTENVSATTGDQFVPAQVTIARNGTVTWSFAKLHNVTFNTANSPTNITEQSSGTASRTFPTAGMFAYHCTLHSGMNGTVEVVAP
jgi:plastocyanin